MRGFSMLQHAVSTHKLQRSLRIKKLTDQTQDFVDYGL